MKSLNKKILKKTKMNEEDPPSRGITQNDNRNNDLRGTRYSRRYISHTLLPLRWKAPGCPCFLFDYIDNIDKLLYN